ncbi:MAG TPA: peptidoglycan bridge formation glycyltransferase FemA/FemB family protein [Syntrophorhabdaceae bacterium]|nr:peptidoglycan bridge formation glycyltransferase FemA/FemB family protein [Syntrophorhabdaceae bacterium]HQM80179.1 peptidoglycan bridge formation glycyltransferase FemA/FemB family protein [Syntrophorhabdaceae bacterium]
MNVKLQRKEVKYLFPTDIVFQTFYWSQVKLHLGWEVMAFDISSSHFSGDVLVLSKSFDDAITVAYVPQGPESSPKPEEYGLFLEALSDKIINHIDRAVAFIRYDLPWESQYNAENAQDSDEQRAPGHPEARLQELRMNFGTRSWNLRKAVTDLTVADTVRLDLSEGKDEILSKMKPKTRYNIHLAQRKGVKVFAAGVEMLPVFYDLYCQTSRRNGFPLCEYQHFSALFSALASDPGSSDCHFLLAVHGSDFLAGGIITISGRTATYLYGASSNKKRNLMGSYAIQWEAIQLAIAKGCLVYDMGAVAPTADPGHPFHGMYRFKTGFGGEIIHLTGSWDYPFLNDKYMSFRNMEALGRAGIR